MTTIQQWVTKWVANAVRDTQKELEPDWESASNALTPEQEAIVKDAYAKLWHDLEQRTAILLIQARATQCRKLAEDIVVLSPGAGGAAMANWLMDNSHRLETLGNELATEDGWPIKEGDEPPQKPSGLILVQ